MHWIAPSINDVVNDAPAGIAKQPLQAERAGANQYCPAGFTALMTEQVLALQRQTANLRRTRDLLLPRLLSGQVDLSAGEAKN